MKMMLVEVVVDFGLAPSMTWEAMILYPEEFLQETAEFFHMSSGSDGDPCSHN